MASSPHSQKQFLNAFQSEYEKKKQQVETGLEALVKSWEHLHAASEAVSEIVKPMKYSLLAGGKRLRPILTLLCYELIQSCKNQALPAMPPRIGEIVFELALSIELIHTYSLIHDDLPAMDDDELRRQKPTCHIAFGEAKAILAGDGLLTEAFQIGTKALSSSNIATKHGMETLALISRAAGYSGMIAGQTFDLMAEKKPISLVELKQLHLLKTGELISAACLIPAYVLGIQSFIHPLKQYAQSIGLAFQITDDILDHTQTSQTLGKPAHSDTKNQKTTYLQFMSVTEAYKEVETLVKEAHEALEAFSSLMSSELKTAPLKGLASYILNRTQ